MIIPILLILNELFSHACSDGHCRTIEPYRLPYITDVVGHSLNGTTGLNNTQCMFQVYRMDITASYPALNMHWSVLIPPNLLLGIGPLIVITTTYEFISSQSPQSMKGLLIGVFLAIRGLFHFLNSIVILLFSFKFPWASGEMSKHSPVTNCGFFYLIGVFFAIRGLLYFLNSIVILLKFPWASGEMLKHPPVTNCGFFYLLFTCVMGLIGLILFSVAAKKYKYRERDEGMFSQQYVEEVYERYIIQAAEEQRSIDQYSD